MSKNENYKQRVIIFTDETCGSLPLITIGKFMEIVYENLRGKDIFVTEKDETIIIRPYHNELENTFKNMKSNNVSLAIFVYLPKFYYLQDYVKEMGKQYMVITKALKYFDISKFIKTKKQKIVKSLVSSISKKIKKNVSYFL